MDESVLENKYPFEREIYIFKIMEYLKEIDEKRRNQTPAGGPGFNPDELKSMGIDPSQFKPGELERYK